MIQKIHLELVQKVIDLLNSDKELIKRLKEEKQKYLEKNDYLGEIRVFLNIEGIEYSLEHSEWVPATDSCLVISIGSKVIEKSM